jgi:hypothetical protein
LKFVSNLTRKSDRFFAPASPSGVSAATSALFASFVKEVVYKANVEHVTISLENAYYHCVANQVRKLGFSSQMEGDKKSWLLHTFNSFELVSIHSFMHVSRKST